MIYEKIQIDKKVFDNIANELNVLKLTTSDSNSRMIAEKISHPFFTMIPGRLSCFYFRRVAVTWEKW